MNNKIGAIIAIAIGVAAISIVGTIVVIQSHEPRDVMDKYDEFDHPCQKAALGNYFLYKNSFNMRNDPNITQAEIDEFHAFVLVKEQEYQDSFLANECPTTQSTWMIPAFNNTMQALLDEGF